MHVQRLEERKHEFLEEAGTLFPQECCFLAFANLTLGETAEIMLFWP